MSEDLEALRKVTEAATPGPWRVVDDADGFTFVDRGPGRLAIVAEVVPSNRNRGNDSLHIATFDPPTVLDLLSRLEQAEQDRDAALEANKRWAHRSSRETSALRKANASIARVRALRNTWCDASYDPMNSGLSIAGTVNAIDRALDGEPNE